ncbi:MAG: monovalent cation/H(+) antiporter subunit G [Shimia sp.]
MSVVVRCILIVLFLLLTAPIAGHMVGRAALRLGVRLYEPKP